MRTIIMLILAVSFLFASEVQGKKGWQLIGVPTSLDIQTSFNNESVEIVWSFDAPSQSWSGYSPDSEKNSKIIQDYLSLATIEPFSALWVFSKSDWKLEFSYEESTQTAKNRTIVLEEGWNLIAIPQQIVVSEEFFGGALVWKYSEDEGWSVNDANLNFPSIESIKESEGLWVKSDESKIINIDEEGSKLHTFKSRDNMMSYIRSMININQHYYGYYNLEPIIDGVMPALEESQSASDDGSKTTDTTTTNLQEEGVDEGDILKHDGVHIFSVDNSNEKIIVTSFKNISKQIYTPIDSIDFTKKYIVSMYLQNSRLSVISNAKYDYTIDYVKMINPQINQNTTLDIFNVSDIENIKLISTHTIDGYYQDSRLIDGELYMISQFTPTINYDYPKLYVDTICSTLDMDKIWAKCSGYSTGEPIFVGVSSKKYEESCEYGEDYKLWSENSCYQYNYDEKGAWKSDYDNPIIVSENLLPLITSNATKATELVSHNTFYAPAKLNQRANITTISRFSTELGNYKTNTSFLGNTHTYYASLTSLYLVSNEYPLYFDYSHYKDQQMIYKFSLDENLSYESRGFVEGKMLNQFSMSEKDDYLRVATTSGWSWWNSGEVNNSVFTLKQKNSTFEVEGKLTGLGHEGETIRSVRFMGNRGFVVTFKQTDPLYTIDLSNPEKPKLVGELSIPGFSSYLHLIDENRLLSIGRNADADGRQRELQFQLFDISDFSNPTLADKILIGDENSYSEAEYNHKAFSYRASDLMFGVPHRDYSSSSSSSSEHFSIYKISDLSIKSVQTLTSNNSEWGNVGRGVIFDLNDTTYGALLKGSNIICEDIKDEEK